MVKFTNLNKSVSMN